MRFLIKVPDTPWKCLVQSSGVFCCCTIGLTDAPCLPPYSCTLLLGVRALSDFVQNVSHIACNVTLRHWANSMAACWAAWSRSLQGGEPFMANRPSVSE